MKRKQQKEIYKNIKVCLLPINEEEDEEEEEDSKEDALLCHADMLQIYCCKLAHWQQTANKDVVVTADDGGYLLGLVAFARKFGRAILSLAILCCILLFSFQFGNASNTSTTSTTIDGDDNEVEVEVEEAYIPPPDAFE